jgi:SOS response regulatory protein OraA/RecX
MMEEESSFQATYNYSIKLLSRMDYSIHKLTQKLKSKNCDEFDIEDTIQKLIDNKFINESEYTRNKTKQFIMKGFSNEMVLQKLEQDFLQSSTAKIAQVREEQGVTELDMIKSLIDQKLKGKRIPNEPTEHLKLKSKLVSFLGSKGYPYEEIESALGYYIK